MSSRDLAMKLKRVAKIGTTTGLDTNCGENRVGNTVAPEQVYVNLCEDPSRPHRIEAWVGYGTPASINLSRRQLKELILLLQEADRVQGYLDAAR